jgi:replicative DNA helicase
MRLAGHYVSDPTEAMYYMQRYMLGDDGMVDHVLAAWDDFERTIWPRMAIVDHLHSMDQVCASIDSLCSRGLRIVPIIDYAQLGADGDGTEYERVTNASHLLQQTAKRWQIPMLALSSLRNIRKEERDQPPNVSQLRGSGHLGYDAGTVMVLRRADSQTHGSERGITAYVVKNRVGPINEDGIPLLFNGGANQFT